MITLAGSDVTVESTGYRRVEIRVSEVEISEILEQIDIKDIIDHYGRGELLDEIGVEFCKEYYDLTEVIDE